MPSTSNGGAAVLLMLLSLLSTAFAQDACPQGPTFSGTPSNCNKWHTIVSGDSCYSLEQTFGITSNQFLEWNPSVSADCETNFWATYAYCVGVGTVTVACSSSTTSTSTTSHSSSPSTTKSITSSVTSSTSSISSSNTTSITNSVTSSTVNATYSTRWPITAYNITTTSVNTAWPPTRTQSGQPSYCISWHLVAGGDTCQSIVNRYGATLSMDNFLTWNPTLGADCSGLFVGWWVCTTIQSQTSATLQWLGASATNATAPSPTAWTSTTYPAINSSFVPVPIQTGVPSDCQSYYLAQSGDTCLKILAEINYITQSQFMAWNPALNGNCNGLFAGYYYCVADFPSSSLPMPATVTTTPSPTGTGSPGACSAWYLTTFNEDCDTVVLEFGTFSKSDFITWNPSVWSDCSNFQEDTYYCVAIPGTPTTRTTPISTTTAPTSIPTQSGMAANCTDVWLVSTDDTCSSVVNANSISLVSFESWNPAVGSNSSSCTLTPDYYVCVGVDLASTTTGTGGSTPSSTAIPTTSPISTTISTTTSSASTSSAGNAVSTPSPVQPGMVDGCVRFYYVESGDGCYSIATEAGIPLSTFYEWNAGASSDCSTLWLDSYCCIGISGPATTITSGTPVPAPTA